MANTVLYCKLVLLQVIILRAALQAMGDVRPFSPPSYRAALFVKLALPTMSTSDDLAWTTPAGTITRRQRVGVRISRQQEVRRRLKAGSPAREAIGANSGERELSRHRRKSFVQTLSHDKSTEVSYW